jgi:hypothetical protein
MDTGTAKERDVGEMPRAMHQAFNFLSSDATDFLLSTLPERLSACILSQAYQMIDG